MLISSTIDDASNNTVTPIINLTHTTSGTPGNGIGTGVDFIAETSAGNNETGMRVAAVTTDVTPGSEDFDLVVDLMTAGATAAEAFRVSSLGLLTVSDISTGSVTVSGTVDGRDVATDGTKLDGIETSADVTDATNVAAAGAVMESDSTTASMSFVVDEDDMTSDSPTKVPTQQSVKAYVDLKLDASAVIDEDDMVSDSNTEVPTQQSVKAYVDSQVVSASDVVEDTTPQLGGDLDGQDNTVSKINLKDYGEITNAIGSTGGGTQDIDLTLGNAVSATVDTSANTFTFSNPTASDELCGFVLVLTNGGSQTVNWPASVDWPSATAPTLSASGVDILVFITIDGGTTWHGMVASTLSS